MGLADEDEGGMGAYGGTVGRGVNPDNLREITCLEQELLVST